MNKIEQLRALLEAATPGDWEVKPGFSSVKNYVYAATKVSNCEDGDTWHPVICVTDDDEPINYEANATLIALMKNALPDLLDAAEELRILVDSVEPGYHLEDARNALEKLK